MSTAYRQEATMADVSGKSQDAAAKEELRRLRAEVAHLEAVRAAAIAMVPAAYGPRACCDREYFNDDCLPGCPVAAFWKANNEVAKLRMGGPPDELGKSVFRCAEHGQPVTIGMHVCPVGLHARRSQHGAVRISPCWLVAVPGEPSDG